MNEYEKKQQIIDEMADLMCERKNWGMCKTCRHYVEEGYCDTYYQRRAYAEKLYSYGYRKDYEAEEPTQVREEAFKMACNDINELIKIIDELGGQEELPEHLTNTLLDRRRQYLTRAEYKLKQQGD